MKSEFRVVYHADDGWPHVVRTLQAFEITRSDFFDGRKGRLLTEKLTHALGMGKLISADLAEAYESRSSPHPSQILLLSW